MASIMGIAVSQLHQLMINNTPLMPIRAFLETHSDDYRNWLITGFGVIDNLTLQSEPIFVFHHSMITHIPFVFSDTGDFPNKETQRDQYVDVIKYGNMLLRNTVDTILSRYHDADREPVIIIQADHGPRLAYFERRRAAKELRDTNLVLRDRIGILNAYYLSDKGKQQLYPNISPVNSFRLILNEYFEADLDLMEDRSYCRFSPAIDGQMPTFGPFVEIRGDSAVYYTKEREVKSVFHFPKRDTFDARQN